MKFYRLCFFIVLCISFSNVFAQIKNNGNTPDKTDSSLVQYKNNISKTFFFAGTSIGTPGALSLNAGYYAEHFALKISGGYWSKEWYGGQGDIEYVLSNTGILIQGISLVAGIFDAIRLDNSGISFSPSQQNYIGVAYDADYSRFYLQSGLGFGLRSYPPNPQLLFQLGYLIKL